ncbi:aminotransferase class IV [Pedobacter insulae]|uniref:branched-chain-amino-acid transaminase n=1 Tax=Pedobacter insulae TaxID=414048 RepID=A0A1I2U888_9SPHI|nr:aminotransferase class IV [Pedobacter insulae]SFG73223.1 D-alanine transaminase [Pedobacter insulae]
MSNRYISINHQLYTEENAKISVSDLSIQRGFGIFDFLKTVDNKAIFLEDHFNRFYNSAKEMNLTIGVDREGLKASIDQLMEKNKMPNSGLKFILTGGFSEDGYTMTKPNLILTQVPFEIDLAAFDKGMKLVTYQHQRQLPTIKTIDYLQAIRLQGYIKENLSDDVLYHQQGSIRECPRANFFIVKDNKVITPKTDILKGITRSKILSLEINNYTISEEDFTLNDIATADEAFISSSTKNALPVLAVDGKTIGDGRPGPITRKINNELYRLIGLQ